VQQDARRHVPRRWSIGLDKIDYAVGFHSYANGLFPTIDLLETSEHGGVRATAAELIALVVKDNPPCQAWAFEGRALERLLALHRGDVKGGGPVGENEKIRAVSAMSALIQCTPEAQLAFLQAGGLDALVCNLGPDAGSCPRLTARTLFVLRTLLLESASVRRSCLEHGSHELLSRLASLSLQEEHVEWAEHASAALEALARNEGTALAQALSSAHPSFVDALRTRVAALKGLSGDEFAQLLEGATNLLGVLEAQ